MIHAHEAAREHGGPADLFAFGRTREIQFFTDLRRCSPVSDRRSF